MDDGDSVDVRDPVHDVDAGEPAEVGREAAASEERLTKHTHTSHAGGELERTVGSMGGVGLTVTLPRMGFLTPVPAHGLVPHAVRMEALTERNKEIEFWAWVCIIGLAIFGTLFRGRY